tara:strand:- start:616 stop:825 length:210 start_codon:yes stop_codon:yes gene_type:complete
MSKRCFREPILEIYDSARYLDLAASIKGVRALFLLEVSISLRFAQLLSGKAANINFVFSGGGAEQNASK